MGTLVLTSSIIVHRGTPVTTGPSPAASHYNAPRHAKPMVTTGTAVVTIPSAQERVLMWTWSMWLAVSLPRPAILRQPWLSRPTLQICWSKMM